jgi:hypothetical protein
MKRNSTAQHSTVQVMIPRAWRNLPSLASLHRWLSDEINSKTPAEDRQLRGSLTFPRTSTYWQPATRRIAIEDHPQPEMAIGKFHHHGQDVAAVGTGRVEMA